jgi:hypothetical protein
MPLTLDKLFSASIPASFVWADETVTIQWAPGRYTGEMDDLSERLNEDETQDRDDLAAAESAENAREAQSIRARIERRDQRAVRTLLATLIVSWDLMDGDEPYPTDDEHLIKLPPAFLREAFRAISGENQVDPPKAPGSDATSVPKASSARSPRGTRSSAARTTCVSRRGK